MMVKCAVTEGVGLVPRAWRDHASIRLRMGQSGLKLAYELVVEADSDRRMEPNDVIGSQDAVVIEVELEGFVKRNSCGVHHSASNYRDVSSVRAKRALRGVQFERTICFRGLR